MTVGEPLDAGVLDVRQPPVSVADFVALVVPAGGRGERRGDAVDTEDRVAHPRPAALVAQDFDPADEPIDGRVARQPPERRGGEVERVGHRLLQHVPQRLGRHHPARPRQFGLADSAGRHESPVPKFPAANREGRPTRHAGGRGRGRAPKVARGRQADDGFRGRRPDHEHALPVLWQAEVHRVEQTPLDQVAEFGLPVEYLREVRAALHRQKPLDVLEDERGLPVPPDDFEQHAKRGRAGVAQPRLLARAAERLTREAGREQVVRRHRTAHLAGVPRAERALAELVAGDGPGLGAQVVGPDRAQSVAVARQPEPADPRKEFRRRPVAGRRSILDAARFEISSLPPCGIGIDTSFVQVSASVRRDAQGLPRRAEPRPFDDLRF